MLNLSHRAQVGLAPLPLVALLAMLGQIFVASAAEGQARVIKTEAAGVKIDNFTFTPSTVMVAPGTTVTWTNEDDIPHTVAGQGGAFRSKALDTEDKFSFTFNTPGEYAYFCSLHPHMVGKVIVEATDAGGAQR